MMSYLLVAVALCLGTVTSFAQEEALQDPTFDSPGVWSFLNFNGGGTGGVAGGIGSITHPGGGGMGGILFQTAPVANLVPGNTYTVTVERNYTALGASGVAELHVGGDPTQYGGGDYPGGAPGGSAMVLKDDCWGTACGTTGGFAPMPQDGGVGNPLSYPGGSVYYVLKVSSWGPGPQTVEFDSASVNGVLDVADWMLY